MAIWPAFVGPAYRSQSPIAAADRCVNWYPEALENSGEFKNRAALYPTPGLRAFAIMSQFPAGNLFAINDRAYAIYGNQFIEVFANGTTTIRGLLSPTLTRPSMASNGTAGNQIAITSGGNGYVFNTSTLVFTPITDVNFPTGRAINMQYIDGYFVVQVEGTTEFRLSALNDGLTWPGSFVAQRSMAQDIIATIAVTHREVWLIGKQTTEVWYNSGATFPLQPVQGVFLQEGCEWPSSVANLGTTLFWVTGNAQGGRRVVRAGAGYTPERISTHAIEYALQSYIGGTDAIGYGYQDQGHEFYVLNIPSQGVEWVFDNTTGLWHERGTWDPVRGDYQAPRGNCHMYAFGKHLIGDRTGAYLWEQSIDAYTDGDALIRRMRRGVHLTNEKRRTQYASVELDMEVGLGVTIGPVADRNPEVMLRYSNDGAKTWSNERRVTSGEVGRYGTRVRFRNLGQGRDRVFEIATSAAIPWRIVNAYIEATNAET